MLNAHEIEMLRQLLDDVPDEILEEKLNEAEVAVRGRKESVQT